MNSNKRNNFIIISLLLFLIVGTGLRLIHIGTPSIWVDEAVTVLSARGAAETGKPVMPPGWVYGRALLYTYSVAAVYHFSSMNLENARIVSAFYGIICIPLTWLIASWIFGWRTGLITAFFIAVSFYEVGWSRVARMYTLLQFTCLLSIGFFFMNFRPFNLKFLKEDEEASVPSVKYQSKYPFAIVLSFAGCFVSIQLVHNISLLLLLCMMFFVVGYAIYFLRTQDGVKKWLNRYTFILASTLILGTVALILNPFLSNLILNFLNYLPAWAAEGSSASLRWGLFSFLFSWYRFPLGILFIFGCIEIIRGRNLTHQMGLSFFLIPLLIQTFVLTHRHPKYLFFVYPLFFMVAAYGLDRLIQMKTFPIIKTRRLSTITTRHCLILLIFLAFVISPWLRIAKNIPWLEDGKTNGAVFFNEWRETAQILQHKIQEGDLIIASLPENLLYYGIKSDWALNDSNLSLAIERCHRDLEYRYTEIYTGSPLIESLNTFIQLIQTHPRGWILVTEYHFHHSMYVNQEIRQYIEENLYPPRWTKNKTIRIYHWDHIKGADDAF